MIGDRYCHSTVNVERDILGTFNSIVEGKLLIILDEMDMCISKKLRSQIYNLITYEKLCINTKGVSQNDDVKNYTHVIVLSNKDFPWAIEKGDRRCMAIDRGNTPAGDFEYYRKIRDDLLPNDDIIRILFDVFMKRDISKFDPKTSRPESEFANMLIDISTPPETKYFIDIIEYSPKKEIIMTSLELFQGYEAFVKRTYLGDAVAKRSVSIYTIGSLLKTFGMDGHSSKHTKKGTVHTFDVEKCREWLSLNKYIQKEDNSKSEDPMFKTRHLKPNK